VFTTLQAYNLVLAATGDAPIDSLANNSYATATIDPFFSANRKLVLSMGFASNVDKQTLAVSIDNKVAVPADCLRLRFPTGNDNLTVRNGYVWDNQTMTNYAQPIEVLVTRDVPFDQLDELTQLWIVNLTCRDHRMRATGEYDGKAAFYDREATALKMRAQNKDSYNNINMTAWGRTISVYGG
jgi:hypothetical protein